MLSGPCCAHETRTNVSAVATRTRHLDFISISLQPAASVSGFLHTLSHAGVTGEFFVSARNMVVFVSKFGKDVVAMCDFLCFVLNSVGSPWKKGK